MSYTMSQCQTRYDSMSPDSNDPSTCIDCDQDFSSDEGQTHEEGFRCYKCMGMIETCHRCGVDAHEDEGEDWANHWHCSDCLEEL